MLRLTLGGEGMVGYPERQEGGYVKLMLAPQLGTSKPTVRTYTIRNQRAGEIDVDFVLHGVPGESAGPATQFALDAVAGDTIEVGGPGPAKPLPDGFEYYFLAGDMTALPAISVNLEALDRGAKGLAVIEIQHEEDRQHIDAPPGVEVRWLVNSTPGAQAKLLVSALRETGWPDDKVYGWVACEFSAMLELRQYLRHERGLSANELYISSYWKSGLTEEAHKVAKREDAQAALASN